MTKDGKTAQDQHFAEDIAEDVADAVDAYTAELEQLRAERDEMKDRFMRVLADAENCSCMHYNLLEGTGLS